jgi:hypothetical protein
MERIMLQRPNALGLIVCQQAIVEERTRNLTLVNRFTRLGVREFPSPLQQFVVCVILNDGIGDVPLELTVMRLDRLETVYERTMRVTFPDPLTEVCFVYRVSECSFPVPGRYQVALLAEHESVAQCVITLYPIGEDS